MEELRQKAIAALEALDVALTMNFDVEEARKVEVFIEELKLAKETANQFLDEFTKEYEGVIRFKN